MSYIKKIPYILCCLCFGLCIVGLNAQSPGTLSFYNIESKDIYLGYNYLGGEPDKFTGSGFHLIEVGYAQTFIQYGGHHGPVSAYYHFSQEIGLNRNFITGTKAGIHFQAWLTSIGFAAVLYTDFDQVNLKMRPELGIGIERFRWVLGYNVPTFGNHKLRDLENAEYIFTFNYSVPVKKKRIEF